MISYILHLAINQFFISNADKKLPSEHIIESNLRLDVEQLSHW